MSNMKDRNEHSKSDSTVSLNEKTLPLGGKSPGVRRIEAISAQLTTRDRAFIFIGISLVSCAFGLDSIVRYTYQTIAAASYNRHSLLATINVIRSIIAAAAQPTAARVSDVFGRTELLIVSVFFSTIGTIIEATAKNFQIFASGSVLHQIGFTCMILLVEVIIADITSLRSRLLFSFIPGLPFLINTWISGNITSAVLRTSSWRWGIGMWAIIFPVCSLPLIVALGIIEARARKNGVLNKYKSPYQMLSARGLAVELFWQLDIIGIILLITVFALILVPLTIAGGISEQWHTVHIIVPIVVGVCSIPVWIIWEWNCKRPIVPFHLLKDRAVWGALGIATTVSFAWSCQGDYLFTVLIVAFDFSILAATRISSLFLFCSVLVGFILGAVVYRVRRLKLFIIIGTVLFLVAFGLLIQYRGSPSRAGQAGMIGAQVFLGSASGLFPSPSQASIQAATKHEHLAVITGIFLACYNIGGALGNTVSGAIWTQVLPSQLEKNLNGFGNSTLASATYASPFVVIASYPVGTDIRTGISNAYLHAQRLLCITGICICIPLIAFSLCLRDPRLPDEQSRPEAETNVQEASVN